METEQPKKIGKYEILSEIGRGGMGVVYRAQDPMMGRQVAIKTVTHGLSSDRGMLQRFYGEAEKMGMLRHPNIITVYDLGEHNGYPYIVMEFVEGDPLDRLIESEQNVSLFDKLRVIEQVCSALAYAHRSQVVHRDVKPANVIVRPDGFAKLLDFGIARQESSLPDRDLTNPGGFIGTIAYMAPERLRGAAFDGRSDIFSAGVLLFELLTGRLPFLGKEFILINQILNDPHPSLSGLLPEYPSALDDILERSLAKEPTDRYQAADEMAAELDLVIEGLKEQSSMEWIAIAKDLAAREDFIGAQNALYRLLKLDSRNAQARAMMKELSTRISHKARATQAESLQRQAEGALRERNFDRAIQLLEEASRLMPTDSEIAAQLDAARSRKQISERIINCLKQADTAKRLGDYDGAREILEKAIQLDTSDSRLRAAYQSLIRQAESAAQQAKLRAVLETTRKALAAREHQAALDMVRQAQAEHPDSMDLQDLANAARDGLLGEQRRSMIEDLEDRIANAVSREEVDAVAELTRKDLILFPADATLLRLQAQIEHTLHELGIAALVEETIRQCVATMNSAPIEALSAVQRALVEAPADDRLLALEERIRQHIGRLTIEETRAAILRQANDALQQKRFSTAVFILQQCVEPVLTPEISQLLAYAREQFGREEKQQLVTRSHAEAQALLREERFLDCVALLSPVVLATGDARLQSLLERAQSVLDQRDAEEAAALAHILPFAEAGCHEQVIAVIGALPASVLGSPQIRGLRKAAVEGLAQERAQLQALGRAYAGLASEYPELMAETAAAAERMRGPGEFASLQEAYAQRRTNRINALLRSSIDAHHQARADSAKIDPVAESNASRRLLPLLPFAGEPVRTEWTRLAGEQRKTVKASRILARFARKK